MSETFYKIRQRGTDLFSSGGETPTWKKGGKIWRTMGHIKAHLQAVRTTRKRWDRKDPSDYSQAEIVTYKTVETAAESVTTLLDSIKTAKKAKELRQDKARNKAFADKEKAKLRELQAKYPEEA